MTEQQLLATDLKHLPQSRSVMRDKEQEMITTLTFSEEEEHEAMDAINVKRTLSHVWQMKEGLRMYLKHMPDKDPVDYLGHLYEQLCEIEHFTK